MIFPKLRIPVISLLFLALCLNAPAQIKSSEIERDAARILLEKDLLKAVEEAEKHPSGDLKTLLLQLSLYRRAANFEKASEIIKLILAHPDFKANRYESETAVNKVLTSEFFTDVNTLLFLAKNYNADYYQRILSICSKNRSLCNIKEIDKELENRYSEENKKFLKGEYNAYFNPNEAVFNSFIRWIYWRTEMNLDTGEILNRLAEEIRKNPKNFDILSFYLQLADTADKIQWLADTINFEQSFDYYRLGNRIKSLAYYSSVKRSGRTPEEKVLFKKLALGFYLKSLEIPFNKRDEQLIRDEILTKIQLPPQIKNFEKQLRFWTKQEIAEIYKDIDEPQKAQIIIEELMKLDRSDISSRLPSQLAGAVQAASGQRVIERKILQEEKAERNSVEYWNKRIAYYRGREENELILNSYLESFKAIPFNIGDQKSKQIRLRQLRDFTNFADSKLSDDGNDKFDKDQSQKEKSDYELMKKAKNFLRREFYQTKSNPEYSYRLLSILKENHFDDFTEDILIENYKILPEAAKADAIEKFDGVLQAFSESEKVPQSKKEQIYVELIKIADDKDVVRSLPILQNILNRDILKYASAQVPLLNKILERKLKESIEYRRNYKPSEKYDSASLITEDYRNLLFGFYLIQKNRRAAFDVSDKESEYFDFSPLIANAAENGEYNEAFEYWKIRANLDRTNLKTLDSLSKYAPLKEKLRNFYTKMKIDESHSPIPEVALKELK